MQLCEHGWYGGGPFDCLHCGGLRCCGSRIPRGCGHLGRAPSMRLTTTEKEIHTNRLSMEIVSDSCVCYKTKVNFMLFFTLSHWLHISLSQSPQSPVLSCPLSLVQHGLAPHYRQSKNWSHDRKSLPYKRPREYERLGRAVVSHSLSRTRLETVKATFVNFGFVIHSPIMGIESEDLGQSETFVLWEWVGWVTHVPPRDQNQLTEHTSLPELFRFGFAPQLFDCISNATCFLSSTRSVLFHTLNNSF